MRRNKVKVKVSIRIFLIVSACALIWTLHASDLANSSRPPIVLGQPFEIGIGQTRTMASPELTVKFESVSEDSRCPRGLDCVSAGQVKVIVGLSQAASNLGTTELTIIGVGNEMPQSTGKIGRYWLRLIEVAPDKEMRVAPSVQRIKLKLQIEPFDAAKNRRVRRK